VKERFRLSSRTGSARILSERLSAGSKRTGLRIAALKKIVLSKEEAGVFYMVHKERPFYDSLHLHVRGASSFVLVYRGRQVLYSKVREIMGATNPQIAAPRTIRKDFADSVERNIVHGSDSTHRICFLRNTMIFFLSRLKIL